MLKPLTSFLVNFFPIFLCLFPLAACHPATQLPTPSSQPMDEKLVFYNWEGDFPEAVIEKFTSEYGIEVESVTYESQEEAIENIVAGNVYDVVTMDNRFIPQMVQNRLIAEFDLVNLPNLKNISPNFRDMVYDPESTHTVPYQWGTTGLLVRRDLLSEPVTSWADLWDANLNGKIGFWRGSPREVLGLALKSLGYSANTENQDELEAALQQLLALKKKIVFIEDYHLANSAALLESGEIIAALGWSYDALEGQERNSNIKYILPKEGAMLWGDNLIIPANSPRKRTAELFINFLMLPEINAEITNFNYYATANQAAIAFIEPEIINDPVIFPSNLLLQKAEIILPLSLSGEDLYRGIWEQFLSN